MKEGQRLGSYKVLSLIGKGGMGEVYRARDAKLGREVALKVLPASLALDPERAARFDREARLLAALNHPNIATIYGVEEHDSQKFLVLEVVEGETLAERLGRGPIPAEEALELGLQIARALEAAHEKGVIHRDLKPGNIKITPSGQIKVLDFGLAKALTSDPANLSHSPTLSMAATREGVVLGTAAYLSPEQVRGEAADERADVWGFGCVMFEMLTGRAAFGGTTVSDILASVLKTDPGWALLPAALHPRVRMLLERCLEKDVRDRYRGIGDARVDIEAALADPYGGFAPPASAASGRRALALLAAAIAFALLAGLTGWYLKPAPAGEVTRFEIATAGSLPEEGATIALSPDGRRVVYPADGRLYLRSMDRADAAATPIPGTAGGAEPFFSPDGEWVGFFTASELRKVSLATDEVISLAPVESGWYGEWDRQGRILFSERGESGIWWVPDPGGTPRPLGDHGDVLDMDHPEVLPGEDRILVTETEPTLLVPSSGEGIRIVALSMDGSGEPREVVPGAYLPRFVPATGHLLYVQGGTLLAAGFDPSTLQLTSEAFPVVEAVSASATGPRASFSVADNGTIAYVEPPTIPDPDRVLAFVDPDDGSREYLDLEPKQYRHPRVSPDGERFAFETIEPGGRSAVWVYELGAGNAPRRLTLEGENMRPVWQDDERLLFASDRDGRWGIWRQSIMGGAPERLLPAESGYEDCPFSWSEGASTLLFTRAGCEGFVIWAVTLDEGRDPGQPRELIPEGTGAELSPDLRYVTYFPGPTEVRVRRFPPTDELWIIGQGGAYPTWSSDGRSLVYRRASQVPNRAAALDEMVRVPVSTGTTFGYDSEEILPIQRFIPNFGYRDYDFAPDGRLLMVFPSDPDYEPPEPGITVILNWYEDLLRRVPLD